VALGCASDQGPNWNPISSEDTKQLFVLSNVNSTGYIGHGFVLTRDGHQPLGITAFRVTSSLFPANPADPSSAQAWLRTVVDSPTVVVRLGQRFTIAGAQIASSIDSQHDVAAFAVIDFKPERALELASSLPAVGDTVFVLAVQLGDSPLDGPRRHPAHVVVSSASELQYVYLASSNPYLTTGAAVLDRDGHVVGLHVSAFISGPQVHGIAVGVNSLRALLPD
jgi:hypothetical protein